MKLTFLGANHEVTGSCTLLEAAGQRYLIDCGMEQGKDVYENQPIPVAPGEIDGVLATHAHIDHTGLLPLLVRNGFRGRIYATRPTAELCSIMLRDSAHIQEFEAEWKNRKGQRSGAEPVEPMYTIQDAEAAIALFRGYDYNKEIELAPGIVIRFVDVGHLLGSSSIEIWVTENGTTTKLVFSGDIGNHDQPIIKDPTYLKDADYVFMESTYGDRSHGPRPDYVAELAKILQRTFDRGGNVVIPSFAVGRTQELLYFIREIKEKNLVTGHGCFPVYIDSPLAIEATRIFKDTDSSCFDEETNALLAKDYAPAVVEYMDTDIVEFSGNVTGNPVFPVEMDGERVGATLMLTLEGEDDDSVMEKMEEIAELAEEIECLDILVGDTPTMKREFWAAHDAFHTSMESGAKNAIEYNITVPAEKIAEMVEYSKAEGEAKGLKVMAYAHVGSGGMHIHAVSDGEKAEFAAKVIELAALIYGKCSELGGSIRGEYGIGCAKKQHLGAEALDKFSALKAKYDPKGILNPGKAAD